MNFTPQAGNRSTPKRRSFLGMLIAVGSAGLSVVLSIPVVRFLLHPLRASAAETGWSDLGTSEEFADLRTPVKRLIKVERSDGWRRIISERPVYVVRRASGGLIVLSSVCPHLGCSVAWSDDRKLFACPCHEGVFASDGTLVSGPPPRAMDELEYKITNGVLRTRYLSFRQLSATRERVE